MLLTGAVNSVRVAAAGVIAGQFDPLDDQRELGGFDRCRGRPGVFFEPSAWRLGIANLIVSLGRCFSDGLPTGLVEAFESDELVVLYSALDDERMQSVVWSVNAADTAVGLGGLFSVPLAADSA